MVSFNVVGGNPGALSFLIDAYDIHIGKAEMAFQKLQDAGITGDKIYILWNDCCNRNTERTIDMILDNEVSILKHFINYEHGRGLRYCPENFPARESCNVGD